MEFIRPKKSSLSLDMAPLIDCVFQLLIFFMLSSSFMAPSLQLALPKASSKDPRDPEQIIISADKTGALFVNSSKVALNQLRDEIANKLEKSSKKSVHFRGDKDIPYSQFVQVMDYARQAGAKQINIVHEGKET